MAYIARDFSATSATGINSYILTAPSGALWVGNVFTGAGEQNDFSYVGINLQTDEAGTLTFQFSQDGTNWSSYPTTQFTIASGINEVHTAWKGGRYVRPVFTGVDGSKTYFRLQTYYSNHPLPLTAPLNQSISADQDATVVRSVVTGQNSAGNYVNVGLDSDNSIRVGITSPNSAFGEIRTAELTPTIQLSFPYNINSDVVTSLTNGTATNSVSQSVLTLSTGATAGSSGSIESVRSHKYRAGQGALVRFTAGFTTGSSVGSRQEVGIGDGSDGFFVEMSGSFFGTSRSRGGTRFFTSQSLFNIDNLDGSGNSNNPSGMNIDPNYVNVFQIQYQWLGFGTVEYSIEEPVTGALVPFHRIQYANQNQLPTVFNPTLPIRYSVSNGPNAQNVSVKGSSAASFTEGIISPAGPVNAYRHSKASGTNTMMLTLRNNSTIDGSTNRDLIRFKIGSFVADGTAAVTYDVYKNATLTSTNYINIDTSRSMVSYDTGSTWSVGTGDEVLFEGLSKADSATVALDGLNLTLRPGETLTVIGNGSNTGASVGFTWLEDI